MIVHKPVLLAESIEYLDVKPGGVYADLTLGLGGHASEILRRLGPGGRLVGFDKDDEAVRAAVERLGSHGEKLTVVREDFYGAAAKIKGELGIEGVDGFLMDLGVSTLQLKTPGRGFSFSDDAPLDMRMDRKSGKSAAELVGSLNEDGLTEIIYKYGEERWARAIARRVVERRKEKPVTTTTQLAEIVKGAIPRGAWPPKTHPATRTFQALRIAVNDELGSLRFALDSMLELLKPGGRAVIISYHSLEDRIVKNTLGSWARGCDCPPDFPKCVCGKSPRVKVLTKKPVLPAPDELEDNPSARSAKLRAAERL